MSINDAERELEPARARAKQTVSVPSGHSPRASALVMYYSCPVVLVVAAVVVPLPRGEFLRIRPEKVVGIACG